jgi:hypothetical protein
MVRRVGLWLWNGCEIVELAHERPMLPATRHDRLVESDGRNAIDPGGHRWGELLGFDHVVQQVEPRRGHVGREGVRGLLALVHSRPGAEGDEPQADREG